MAGYGTFTKWLPALNLNFFPAVDRKSSAPIRNDAMTRHGHSAPATFGYIAASELVVANPIIDRNHLPTKRDPPNAVSLDALATRIQNSKLLPQFCRKNLVGVSYWVEDDEGGGTMFAWILILSSWGALLSLILHDATKEDTYGSAILIAARKIKAFTFWAMLEARKRALSLPPTKKWLHKDGRVSMTAPALELAILESVKKAAPGCEDFVGVIVQHNTPQSHLDANWAIRGVKFGRADRPVADEALATVVERMQREFLLSKD